MENILKEILAKMNTMEMNQKEFAKSLTRLELSQIEFAERQKAFETNQNEFAERQKAFELNQNEFAKGQEALELNQKEGFKSVTTHLESLEKKVDRLADTVEGHLIENINTDNLILNEVHTMVVNIEKKLDDIQFCFY